MFADIYSNYTGFSFAINGVRDKRHLYGKTYLAFMKNTDEKNKKSYAFLTWINAFLWKAL